MKRLICALLLYSCQPLLLMATGSLIGEGFDLPELDTLIISTPLSFEGRIVQYAGRIHRLAKGKTEVQIIDFVDSYSAMLLKMYPSISNSSRYPATFNLNLTRFV